MDDKKGFQMIDLLNFDLVVVGVSLFASISDFVMYKVLKYVFSRKIYKEEVAKQRYKEYLKSMIAVKSTIPVPILVGIFYVVSRFVFHVDRDWIAANPWIIGVGFVVCWVFWCLLLWICRRIYKRIRRHKNLPSSFYDQK